LNFKVSRGSVAMRLMYGGSSTINY